MLLGWILPLALAVSVALRRNKDLRQKLFVLFAGNVTLYYLFSFLYVWRAEPWFERLALVAIVALPQSGLRFFRAFSLGARGMGRLGGVAALLGAVLLVAILYPTSLGPAVGPALLVYVLGFMLAAILNLNVQAKAVATRFDQVRIRYLAVGGLAALCFQAFDHIDQLLDIELPPLGLATTLVYLYIISQSIVRYRVLDLYEMLGRFSVLTLMGIALAGIYAGLLTWGGDSFVISAFLASLVILILFDPLRDLVEHRIAEFFFRERRVLEQEVGLWRRQLTHIVDVAEMNSNLVELLGQSRRLTNAALYLADARGQGFDLAMHVGPVPAITRLEAASVRRWLFPSVSSRPSVAATVTSVRERLLQEDAQEAAQSATETIELHSGMNADVTFPVTSDDQLLGLLAVRDDRLRDPFSPEDVAVLNGLAIQIATTLEGSRVYEQLKERDRLAALGQMAAGLAHEIRNPLASIKGAAQIIEEISGPLVGDRPEAELVNVIVEEVDRLSRVVSDFLSYARPATGKGGAVNVDAVLRRTLQLVAAGQDQAEITLDLSPDLPAVEMDPERMHQVFLNLALNALQAMEGCALRRLDISTRARTVRSSMGPRRGVAEYVETRFSDTGPGIAPEVIGSIFIPFFTTKENGIGLGLPVCQRLVRDAGGEIEVRSQLGRGTIFTVVLPAIDKKAEAVNP
jgi:nitrogen-specific signal transduction histidine kinase